VKEVTGRVGAASFVMLRPDRCVIAKELYWGKGHRPRPEDQLAVDVFAILTKDAAVMLDIGAYTGFFTLASVMVNPKIHAHAFEMVPDVFRALFDNCIRNDVLHRVTLHHVGVDDEKETIRVPSATHESALPSFYSSRLHFDTGARVRFQSLDDFTPLLAPGASVIMKIDVEGTENRVLRSGRNLLATHSPDILCEVLAGVARPAELESLLAPLGYRFYLVRRRDLLPVDHIEADTKFRDWLFTPRPPLVLVEKGVPVAGT
jgi:FkbM family methyltransferase